MSTLELEEVRISAGTIRKERRSQALQLLTRRTVFAVALVALWWLISKFFVDPLFISTPQDIVKRLWEMISTGLLREHWVTTFSQVSVGFATGYLAGLVIGNFLGLVRPVGILLEPFVNFVYGIPRIAIAPLFVIWFGIGFQLKAVFVAFVVLFVVAIASLGSIQQTDRQIVNGVRVMGSSGWELFRTTLLPQQIPSLMTAFKITFPHAVAADIVAEFISSNKGLGYLMANAATVLDTTTVLSIVIVVATTITVVLGILGLVERRMLRWQAVAH